MDSLLQPWLQQRPQQLLRLVDSTVVVVGDMILGMVISKLVFVCFSLFNLFLLFIISFFLFFVFNYTAELTLPALMLRRLLLNLFLGQLLASMLQLQILRQLMLRWLLLVEGSQSSHLYIQNISNFLRKTLMTLRTLRTTTQRRRQDSCSKLLILKNNNPYGWAIKQIGVIVHMFQLLS